MQTDRWKFPVLVRHYVHILYQLDQYIYAAIKENKDFREVFFLMHAWLMNKLICFAKKRHYKLAICTAEEVHKKATLF